MSEITVANGWKSILAEAVAEASKLPEQWGFEIEKAETVDGALKLSATYNAFDMPLDDYLPPDRKLPHPRRSFQRIRETARAKSLVTCECCGRMGRMIGAGGTARVRCAAHADVVDAMAWVSPEGVLFDTDEEAMAHFQADYGAGIDMMQELQAETAKDSDDAEEDTRH